MHDIVQDEETKVLAALLISCESTCSHLINSPFTLKPSDTEMFELVYKKRPHPTGLGLLLS